jgi:hypothetical protein
MNRYHFTAKRSLISLLVQQAIFTMEADFQRKPKVKHAHHRSKHH